MKLVTDNLIVSNELYSECFCCDLNQCKGICCVEGDSGAPLEEEECLLLEKEWPVFKPFMQSAGIEAIQQQGAWVIDLEGDRVTPLIKGKECAYAFFEKGVCFCAIERAWSKGLTSFKKPSSCWLYPIRVQKLADGALALNYHEWSLCDCARRCGAKKQIRVYEFLKEPLTEVFGQEVYDAICEAGNR